MRVIGVDDKGNVIIEKTFNAGRAEEMIMTAETVSAVWESWKTVEKAFREIMQALMPVFQKLAEEYIRILDAVQRQEGERIADIAEDMERAAEVQEERRIRRATRIYQKKQRSRIKGRTQQAKSTLKYKRYELRIYSRKERQGFHD